MTTPAAGNEPGTLTLAPIGVVRTGFAERAVAPRQPAAGAGVTGTIELHPGHHYEDALADLDGFDRIWVLFWFHGNRGWRPRVLPPRSTSGRKGVFATRAPHRPNPLGLSAVRLERIAGLTLHVRDIDLLDGTPVLDLKPYVPYTDAFPDARSGWLATGAGTGTAPSDPVSGWTVAFTPLAAGQAAWVEAQTGLALRERIEATLALGPQPHAYRRIRRAGDGWQLAVRAWRAWFRVAGRHIEVTAVGSGYRPSALSGEATADDLDPHRAFLARWGDATGSGARDE
jgi:tRNA-Thr(GGU) m(6)t(6)A37 methyltransferase TsaA